MKKNQNGWIKVVFVLILALLLVACSNEDPTPASEEPIATAEQPEAEQPIADQPEISQPIANEPEISQPIYRCGEVADKQWVRVGYGDPANPTVVAEGTKITAVFSSVPLLKKAQVQRPFLPLKPTTPAQSTAMPPATTTPLATLLMATTSALVSSPEI